jgi:hypothetical protein
MASAFKIGTTSGGITSLDALGTACPDPQWEFQEFRKVVRLGNGSSKGLGPQTVTWNFPILEDAQIAMLETFLSASAIFIQSKKRDGTTGIFEVYMNWLDPRQDGDHMAGFRGYRSGLAIEFFILSEV